MQVIAQQLGALYQPLGQYQVVVAEKDSVAPHIDPLDEINPSLDQRLAVDVLRMGLAGHHQLNRTLWIRQNGNEAFRVMQEQIGPLVCCKAAGKAQGQSVWIENTLVGFGIFAASGKLAGEPSSHEANQFETVLCAKVPQCAVRGAAYIISDRLHCPPPTLAATVLRP